MEIEQANLATVTEFWSTVESKVQSAEFLEDAAQIAAAGLYRYFEESVVLARIFVTVPYAKLPESNREFVRGLVESAGAADDLKPTTPVLSLVGTYGEMEKWQDRRMSQGHVGIPLVSSSFLDAIPMISRLLKEFGVPVDWVDSHDSETIVNTIGSASGLFFVENAASAADSQGRNVIPAQDFVSVFRVQSVFGIGGAYPTGDIAVIIAFCRSRFERAVAERFLALSAYFMGRTTDLVVDGEVFRE